MKLDDIFALWNEDAKINREEVGLEALKISELHNKYYKIYVHERLVFRKYEVELKKLKLAKQEFYIMGPTEETHALGWNLPPQGKILRSDVQLYVEADPDIVKLTLKVGVQQEKLSFLESILKTIHNRNFNIKSYLEDVKIKNGIL